MRGFRVQGLGFREFWPLSMAKCTLTGSRSSAAIQFQVEKRAPTVSLKLNSTPSLMAVKLWRPSILGL